MSMFQNLTSSLAAGHNKLECFSPSLTLHTLKRASLSEALALLSNIRLGGDKRSSLFGLFVGGKEKVLWHRHL
jgi:hypothetical protein